MKSFSFSDLSRRSGDVLDAALAGPVSLVKRGKPKVVMIPVDDYRRLIDMASSQQAYSLDTASEEDLVALVEGFRNIVDQSAKGSDG